jgi:type I restriction-modification system DNA methylase subunit
MSTSYLENYSIPNPILNKNENEILANEPFGVKNLVYVKNCCKKIKSLKINGTTIAEQQFLQQFLQLIMVSLKKNGYCAIVVPDAVVFNDANLHTNTIKYLIKNLNLKKVVSLNGDFFLNTGVKTSILFFKNEKLAKNISRKRKLIEIENENKTKTILDPVCGTGGFMHSALLKLGLNWDELN